MQTNTARDRAKASVMQTIPCLQRRAAQLTLPAPVPATPAMSPKELELDKAWISHPCHTGHSRVTDGHCQGSPSALGGLQGANAAAQEPACTPCQVTHIPQPAPTSVLPTPLEPEQRLRMPKTCRHSLSLGTHLPRPPHSSWYRRAAPTLAELWTPGQMGQSQPISVSVNGSAQVMEPRLGAGLPEGCHGNGDHVLESRMVGQRYEEDPGLSTLSHLPCILHCVLCTEHPVATSAHPALH